MNRSHAMGRKSENEKSSKRQGGHKSDRKAKGLGLEDCLPG